MRCPFCLHEDSLVKDSRSSEDGLSIKRRRHCLNCNARFTTFERVQMRELVVIKKSGQKRPFDREKLVRSIEMAIRKRPIDHEQVEQIVSGIVAKLEASGEHEIRSSSLGELVMEQLAQVDPVAYIRFASVYKEFRDMKDFESFISSLNKK